MAKLKPEVKVLDIDGMSFRDLNKNNKLDRYEDYRLDTAQRVEDLISQMTLEEKVGTLFHPPVTINPDWMFRLIHYLWMAESLLKVRLLISTLITSIYTAIQNLRDLQKD